MATLVRNFRTQTFLALAIAAALLSLVSCGQTKRESEAKPWQMGEKVPLGPFEYSVVESEWKTELTGSKGAIYPKQRFLLLKITVSNRASERKSLSFLTLRNDKNEEFPEVQDLEGVPGWLGFLRDLRPAATDAGTIAFDVSPGHYRLVVNDGGTAGEERTSLVDLPLNMIPGADDKPITGR